MRSFHPLVSLLALSAFVLCAAPTVAFAEEHPDPPGLPANRVWYGGPSIALDAAAVTLFVVGIDEDGAGQWLTWAAVGTYVLGAPTVHVLNRQYGRAAGSLALRVGVPVATFYAVSALADCDRAEECMGGALAGLFGAAIATTFTMAFDDFGLARKDRPVQRAWTPSVAPTSNGGMTFGVVGTF
jgi:hypothetical protein